MPILAMYANASGRKTSRSEPVAQGGCNFDPTLAPSEYKTSDPLLDSAHMSLAQTLDIALPEPAIFA